MPTLFHLSSFSNLAAAQIRVAGHEAQVFAGGKAILSSGRVRDILFEEFAPYPAETHRMLEEHGFQIFVVTESVRGPVLVAPSPTRKSPAYAPPNYVATRDVERLLWKFHRSGWHCISGQIENVGQGKLTPSD